MKKPLGGILTDIRNIGLSFAVMKLYKEGKKLQDRDLDDKGRDDIAGGAMVTGAMLIDELSDGDTNRHEAIATALEDLAAQIRREGQSKQV